jgi:hypothetical protein
MTSPELLRAYNVRPEAAQAPIGSCPAPRPLLIGTGRGPDAKTPEKHDFPGVNHFLTRIVKTLVQQKPRIGVCG